METHVPGELSVHLDMDNLLLEGFCCSGALPKCTASKPPRTEPSKTMSQNKSLLSSFVSPGILSDF